MRIPVGRQSRLASVLSIAVALLFILGAWWAALPSYTGTLGTDSTPVGLQGTGFWAAPEVSKIA